MAGFRNENVCHARDPGAKDPYHVNYDTAERMPSEDGVSYAPPLHQTADEPASSWTAEAYAKKPEPAAAAPAEPVVAATEPAPPPPAVEEKPAPDAQADQEEGEGPHARSRARGGHAKPGPSRSRRRHQIRWRLSPEQEGLEIVERLEAHRVAGLDRR